MGSEDIILFGRTQTALQTPFDPTGSDLTSENTEDAIKEAAAVANAAVYTLPLIWNGTISGTQFLSYSNLTPNSPIIIPTNSNFVGFTFSNAKTGADYTINIRNNTNAGTPFYTISQTNTQFFAVTLPTPELFNAGDFISVEYVDDGTNGNDVVVILTFKAVP